LLSSGDAELAKVTITRLKSLAAAMAKQAAGAGNTDVAQVNACAEFAAWIENHDGDAGGSFAAILATASRKQILQRFKALQPFDDICIQFSEELLAHCQPQQRQRRGVYYSPQAVAAFMVRGVDHLLTTHFQLSDGIASDVTWQELQQRTGVTVPENADATAPFVNFFDPATGAGVFPVEVIKQIFARLTQKWQSMQLTPSQMHQNWQQYAPQLLARLHGCEIMPAACGVARRMVAAQLLKTGYQLQAGDEIKISCASALEPDAAATSARNPLTVVLGNPPYSNYGDSNQHEWIMLLLEDYKRELNERKLNLNDDFIKFIRRGQHDIQQAGAGILMFVTSNTYLEGVTHRRMRQSLLQTFPTAYLLNLHGSARQGAATAQQQTDESVFSGIQQGTSISAMVRGGAAQHIHHAELRGARLSKQRLLLETSFADMPWRKLTPRGPAFYLHPVNAELTEEYNRLLSVCDLFGVYGPGIKTERDTVAIQHTAHEMQQVVHNFRTLPAAELRRLYNLPHDSRDWKVAAAMRDVLEHAPAADQIADPVAGGATDPLILPVLYRPFDLRFTWYSGRTRGFIGTPGAGHMRHMTAGGNLGLHVSRTVYGDIPWRDVFITSTLSEFGVLAALPANTATLFPANLYPNT